MMFLKILQVSNLIITTMIAAVHVVVVTDAVTIILDPL